ncbi:MAG: hypothetical protein KGM97_09295 [Alphaproteobacteria bacterium]|nr:hypothetical protein [Alphaproteobacteria bacterium]MDE2631171.1 hypothetical protein [Alphaproteobacteria bacterium]
MASFAAGDSVQIPCEVQVGAFPTECLITFETLEGRVSGFVRREALRDISGSKGFLPATVVDVKKDTITVRVQGSFFTTTGLAYLKRDWADSNVRPLRAVA